MMHKNNYTLVICCLLALVLLSGCLSTKISRYTDEKLPPTPKEFNVQLVHPENIVEVPYDVIGYIEIKASELYSADFIINRLRKKARAIGGDAISDVNQQIVEEKFPSLLDYLNFYGTVWSAEVIRWGQEEK